MHTHARNRCRGHRAGVPAGRSGRSSSTPLTWAWRSGGTPPTIDDSDWPALRTDDWEGWENQGLTAESDFGWYRVRYEVPEALQSKKHVYLYFNCVDEQAWVWLNGHEVGEHTLAQ